MSENMHDGWTLGGAVGLASLLDVQADGVVSRTILKKKTGTVTVFAFDAGQGLSEHTTPFDALLMDVEGEAEITISGAVHSLSGGEIIRLPANQPHAVNAVTPFKMLLIMIRE